MHDHGAMLDHGGLLAALPPGSIWALAASLFLVGLGGGFLHCAGMCGPFVLAQVGFRVDKTPGTIPPGLRRLTGGALVPLICPHQSGPSTILVWTLKERENGQETRA